MAKEFKFFRYLFPWGSKLQDDMNEEAKSDDVRSSTYMQQDSVDPNSFDVRFLAHPNFDIHLQEHILTEKRLHAIDFQWVKRPRGVFGRLWYWIMHSSHTRADRVCDALRSRLQHGDYSQFNQADFDQLDRNLEKLKDKFTHKKGYKTSYLYALLFSNIAYEMGGAIDGIQKTAKLQRQKQEDVRNLEIAEGLRNEDGDNLQAQFKKFDLSNLVGLEQSLSFNAPEDIDAFFQRYLINKNLNDNFEYIEKPRSITAKIICWFRYGGDFQKDRFAESLAIRIYHGDYSNFSLEDFDKMIVSINGNPPLITGIRYRLKKNSPDQGAYIEKALDEAVGFLQDQKVKKFFNSIKVQGITGAVEGKNILDQGMQAISEGVGALIEGAREFLVRNENQSLEKKSNEPTEEKGLFERFTEQLPTFGNGDNQRDTMELDRDPNAPVEVFRMDPQYEEVVAPYDKSEDFDYDHDQYELVVEPDVLETYSELPNSEEGANAIDRTIERPESQSPPFRLPSINPLINDFFESSANLLSQITPQNERQEFQDQQSSRLSAVPTATSVLPFSFFANPSAKEEEKPYLVNLDEPAILLKIEECKFELDKVQCSLKNVESFSASDALLVLEFGEAMRTREGELLAEINELELQLNCLQTQRSEISESVEVVDEPLSEQKEQRSDWFPSVPTWRPWG